MIGNDPRQWKTGIPAYARVAYHDVYPGVDLVYYGTQQQLEYDFVVRPGASPADIGFDIAGARAVKLDDEGESRHRNGARIAHASRARALSGWEGTRRAVDAPMPSAPTAVSFTTGPYDLSSRSSSIRS